MPRVGCFNLGNQIVFAVTPAKTGSAGFDYGMNTGFDKVGSWSVSR